MSLPGAGALGATALLAAVGEEPRVFRNGRALAAWLGLVPRQQSTGGRPRLLGISKRGDVYLRQVLIHGARAVLARVEQKDDPLSRWVASLTSRRHTNIATVALANKIARMAWAVLTSGNAFDQRLRPGVRRWLPELASLPDRWIHEPWRAPASTLAQAGVTLGRDYPLPILDLEQSRREALGTWERLKDTPPGTEEQDNPAPRIGPLE